MSQPAIHDSVVAKLPESVVEFYKKGRREWFANAIRPYATQFAFDQWFTNADSEPLAKIMQNMNIYDKVYLDKVTTFKDGKQSVGYTVTHRLYLNDDFLTMWVFTV